MKAREARRLLRERTDLVEKVALATRRLTEVREAGEALLARRDLEGRNVLYLEGTVEGLERQIAEARQKLREASDRHWAAGRDLAANAETVRRTEAAAMGLEQRLRGREAEFRLADERLAVVEARKAEEVRVLEARVPLSPENVEGLKFLHRVFSAKVRRPTHVDHEGREVEHVEEPEWSCERCDWQGDSEEEGRRHECKGAESLKSYKGQVVSEP